MSPEGNIIKTSIFPLDNLGVPVVTDLAVMNDARVILGPYIQSFDEKLQMLTTVVKNFFIAPCSRKLEKLNLGCNLPTVQIATG